MARMSNSCPVVLHVDLDCFYAAVEQVRLGIPVEQPLAVQQWEGLIAVNYAARAAGVVRHDRASEALRKCPDLHLVHVETIGNDGGQTAASRLNAKVSLERYRQASKQVLMIFHRFADISERASIDEAYLDVTKQVDQMVQKDYDWDYELQCLLGFQSSVYKQPDNKNKQSMIIEGDGTFSASDICDRRLLAGGMIADRLRSTVKGELGYTCSVGIATNKLLAKIASARHKPDTQTLIPPKAIPGLMQTLPLKKIKLLGGKVGEKLTEKWGCITAGEAQSVSLVALVSSFGNRLGEYVWKAVRGIQDEKVQEKQMPKSMLAAKSFQAINDFSSVRKWLRVLADELAIRMLDDVIQNHRQPHILQLYYRCGKKSSDQSKSCPMPPSILHSLSSMALVSQELPSERTNTIVVEESLREEHGQSLEAKTETVKTMQDVSIDNELKNADGPHEEKFSKNITVVSPEEEFRTDKAKMVAKLLQEASFRLFQRIDGSFPCTRLAIAATGYQDGPIQGSQSIQHFFGNLSERKTCIVEDLHPLSVKDLQAPKAKGLLKFLSPDHVNPEVKSSSWVSGRSGTQLQISDPGDDATEIEEQENIVADWHDKDLPAAEPEDIGIPFAVASSCQETIEVSNQVGHFSGSQLHKHLQNEVDLIDVNVEEQHHILKDIYKAKLLGESFHQRNHVKLQEGQVPKRRKVTSCKSGQQPISKFFPSNQ